MAMNSELKTKWLAALRSGEYEQGTGQLMTRDKKYCCLGVLAHVAGDLKIADDKIEGGRGSADTQRGEGYLTVAGELSDCCELPDEYLEKYGLSRTTADELINMNDGGRYAFTTIADWVEGNL